MSKKKRMVVVTTDSNRRGVFAGELVKEVKKEFPSGSILWFVTLKNAQMCVYWSPETHGVLGLAATGPAKGSRITPQVLSIELDGVTSIMDMTDEAVKKWRAEPWS